MKQKTIFLLLLFLALAACSPAGGEPGVSDTPATETPDLDEFVSSDDPTATPVPVETIDPENAIVNEAQIETLDILILESFPVQVLVHVTGYLGDGCTALGDIQTTQEGNTFLISITSLRPAGALCTQQLVSFDENIALDVVGLAAGTYTVSVNGVTDTFTLDIDNVPQLPGTEDGPTSELDLPAEDVAELLRLTLERALVAQEIPDYMLLAEQPEIVLSTENIDPTMLPELSSMNLITMTPEEIQAQADAEGDFPYLRFQGFTAVSNDEVNVSLGSTWARATDSETFYLSGGGFTINFTRTGTGWTGQITEAWIS